MAKLTMSQTKTIREHMQANGVDPFSISPKEFIDYAKKHGLIDGDKKAKRAAATTAAKTTVDDTAVDEDAPTVEQEPEHMMPPALSTQQIQDIMDKATGDVPMPKPQDFDMTDPEQVDQYKDALQQAKQQQQEAVQEALLDAMQKVQTAAQEAAQQQEATAIEFVLPELPEQRAVIEKPHAKLQELVTFLRAGVNVYMHGPAGSGKTTLAKQAAEVLQTNFYFTGKLSEEYGLTGYNNANGDYVKTAFYEACVNGGVFLKDELDASDDKAVTKFNAALANKFMDFPCGRVDIDPTKTFFVAAGNTGGQGGNKLYLRNQLDGATLDRFAFMEIEYDETLERSLALNVYEDAGNWVDFVQRARANVEKAGLAVIISPRASIDGAKLLKAGVPMERVKEAMVYKALPEDTRAVINRANRA